MVATIRTRNVRMCMVRDYWTRNGSSLERKFESEAGRQVTECWEDNLLLTNRSALSFWTSDQLYHSGLPYHVYIIFDNTAFLLFYCSSHVKAKNSLSQESVSAFFILYAKLVRRDGMFLMCVVMECFESASVTPQSNLLG